MKQRILKLFSSNLLLTIANLLRDVCIATFLGASTDTDLFFLAVSVPVLLITIASNAGRNIFVPMILHDADTVARLEIGGGVVRLVFRVCLVVFLSTLTLSAIAGWGAAQAGIQETTVRFCLVFISILPMYWVSAVLETLQGPLQAFDHYFVPGLLRLGLPLGLMAGSLFWGDALGIWGLIAGGAVASLISMLGLLWLLDRFRLWNPSRLDRTQTARVKAGFAALILAYSISYVGPVVDQWMAGTLGAGAVSLLGYSSRMIIGLSSLVAGSAAPVVLAFYCARLALHDVDAVAGFYRSFIRIIPWVGGFATLLVWMTSDMLVAILFEHGSISAKQGNDIARLMDLLALQFPFYFASVAAYTLISAIERNAYFIRLGLAMFLFKVAGNYVLMKLWGLDGIAIATVLVNVLSLGMMNHFLAGEGYYRYHWLDGCGLLLLSLVIVALACHPSGADWKVTFHNALTTLPYWMAILSGYVLLAAAVVVPAWRMMAWRKVAAAR